MNNKLRVFVASLVALLGIMLAGCQSEKVCDARGPDEICEIHHRMMQTVVVENEKKPLPSREYLQARSQGFIHSYPFLLPEGCKKCAVWICEDCVRAEEEWKRNHQE